MILTGGWGEAEVLEQIPSAPLFTTSFKWTGLGLNPGLRGKNPATNLQSHGTAQEIVIFKYGRMGTNDKNKI